MIVVQSLQRDHRLTIAEWRAVSKLAWQAAGETWHVEILPRHFTTQGARDYGYQRRSAKYQERKLKVWGHDRPLTYSGDLEHAVARIRDVRVVGDNSKRAGAAKIVLHGPRYLFAYRKDLKQPNKAAELQAVSRRDARILAARMDAVIGPELDRRTRKQEL